MIEIFLGDNYDKDLLKAYLEFIKESASRELKYGTDVLNIDVCINTGLYLTGMEAKDYSSSTPYKDDLVTHISENGIGCYINGVSVNADIVLEYIGEM